MSAMSQRRFRLALVFLVVGMFLALAAPQPTSAGEAAFELVTEELSTPADQDFPECLIPLALHVTGEQQLSEEELLAAVGSCDPGQVSCTPGSCCCGGGGEPMCCDATCITHCVAEDECCVC